MSFLQNSTTFAPYLNMKPHRTYILYISICLWLLVSPLCIGNLWGKDFVVVIDAGHGGSDPGKVGNSNILEKDINLSLALKLQKLLEKKNYKVYMTRNGDYNLADSKENEKRSDLSNRKQLIFENDPMAVISIHQNSYPSSDVHGAQVFYPQGSEKSKQLADLIQSALIKGLDPNNHREAKANAEYYLFRDNPYPIVIVECGFLSNPE